MPIRLTPDNNGPSNDNYPGGGGGGGGRRGGGGGLNFLPIIISLLSRNPKLAIVAIIIGGIFYFKGGCNTAQLQQVFNTGASFDQKQYDKAQVFEPLAYNDSKNPLPEQVSLLQYCPDRLNQGQQGSCVAWSSGYAARTILEARKTNANPNQVAFSPAFQYNQIKLDGCQGSYIIRAMELMKDKGSVPFNDFPYDDQDCSRQPANNLMQKAQQYTMTGFNRLTKDGDNYSVDLNAMRQNLAQGAPVVIGMMVGGSFMQNMMGVDLWMPTKADYDMNGFGGHAMCVIGYDDNMAGEGAFQIMNSWGGEWGKNGVAWVRYKDFEWFTKEAYGVFPMGSIAQPINDQFKMNMALVNNDGGTYIPLSGSNGTYQAKLKKGDRFKIEVDNSIACYTYVIGQETNGSSYLLFPYSPKHSPYCGITGTRLFPKNESLTVDDIGSRDYFAVIATKNPMDYQALNTKISNDKGVSFAEKVNNALAAQRITNVAFNLSNKVSFECNTNDEKNAVAIVFAIDK
ncbi:MAG: hypothetical protein RIQ89_2342 [Bacteroidota bacterium]|jgi:C1A family cysteine protease